MSTPIHISTHVYKVAGDLSLTIDVHIPEGYNKDTGTALIHFHGGFLVFGEKTTLPPYWLINACHSRGWAYATPSYRLLPEANGAEVLQDALDATNWVRDNLAKSNRLIVAGSSAGGYLALAVVAHPQSPPVLGLLSVYGMLDLTDPRYVQPGTPLMAPVENLEATVEQIYAAKTKSAAIDGYEFPELQNMVADQRFTLIRALQEAALYPDVISGVRGLAQQIRERGVDAIPEDSRQLFPASFGLHKGFPPSAFLHGDSDIVVDVGLSRKVAKALENLGVKVLLEVVEGQGHGFDVLNIPADVDVLKNPLTNDIYSSLSRVFKFIDGAAK